MADSESLEEFYRNKSICVPDNLQWGIGHFNVFRVEDYSGHKRKPVRYSRRDYYKIALMRGRHAYHYADKSIEISGSTLIFFNPAVPYKFERLTENTTGFFCIFKEAFFAEHLRAGIKDWPIYQPGCKPAFVLNRKQDKDVSALFSKIIAEQESDYKFKYDLIRNYVMEIIHFALKMEPSESLYAHTDANTRLTTIFTELLERQFPVESPGQQFALRSAKDFAAQLNVHINHLNRAVRTITGKTTTILIAERLLSEAFALLRHTDWNISEISYSLGFEEPAHFNHFFKKHAGTTPSDFRDRAAVHLVNNLPVLSPAG
ncbi:helix-turn-helix domain-containing protein [Chitinophagaceae bacterium MMS25-I14]